MAYLAMARKWRPRNFEEMVGQDHIAQTIRNAIEGKRISHAYLFTGTRGVGKTTSARILAKALTCEKGPLAVPCEACANCLAVSLGNSLDVLEIDGASNNSVDNIRDLREQVKYAPMHGSYKIYIIDEVHMLSKPAFNALLKTLEEPPPHVVFIFATTEAGKVPHTILSRVQRFDFKRISETHIRERLEFICSRESISPEREALEAIARKADGSMRDALSLFDQVYAYSGAALTLEAARKVLGLPREGLFDALMSGLIAHDQKACFEIVQDAHREGIETQDFLIAFGEYLRNALFARQGVGPSVLGMSESRHAELAAAAPELRDGDIIRFAKLVSDLLASLKTAANPRLAVELGFARMAALDRVVSLSQVLGQDLAGSAPESAEAKKKSPPEARGSKPPVPKAREEEAHPAEAFPAHSSPASPAFATSPRPSAAFPTGPADALMAAAPPVDVSSRVEVASQMDVTSQVDVTAQVDVTSLLPVNAPVDAVMVSTLAAGSGAEGGTRYSQPAPEDAAETMDGPETEVDEDLEPMGYRPPPVSPAEESARGGDPEGLRGNGEPPVPLQDGPADLAPLWPSLAREYMTARPLRGSTLRETSLRWEAGDEGAGEPPALRLVFASRVAFSLVEEDADFRKAVHSFLASKLRGKAEFQLRFAPAEGSEAPLPGSMAAGAAYGPEEAMRREPIIAIVRDVFDGRIVDAPARF